MNNPAIKTQLKEFTEEIGIDLLLKTLVNEYEIAALRLLTVLRKLILGVDPEKMLNGYVLNKHTYTNELDKLEIYSSRLEQYDEIYKEDRFVNLLSKISQKTILYIENSNDISLVDKIRALMFARDTMLVLQSYMRVSEHDLNGLGFSSLNYIENLIQKFKEEFMIEHHKHDGFLEEFDENIDESSADECSTGESLSRKITENKSLNKEMQYQFKDSIEENSKKKEQTPEVNIEKTVTIKINSDIDRNDIIEKLQPFIDEKIEVIALIRTLDGNKIEGFIKVKKPSSSIIDLFLYYHKVNKISVSSDKEIITWLCENIYYWNVKSKSYQAINPANVNQYFYRRREVSKKNRLR
jgi:hypothetical protein